MRNLHPNNIFVNLQNPGDIRLTDVGLAWLPTILPEMTVHCNFLPPEIKNCKFDEVEEVYEEYAGNQDIYTLGLIAMFLATGNTDSNDEIWQKYKHHDETHIFAFVQKCL